MNRYINAREGYEFAPTEKGKELGRISSKFDHEYRNREQYIKQVPESWIKNGYVEEVPK